MGGGEKSGGNSASTETQRRSREHGNGAEGGRNARGEERGGDRGQGGREACTCRQTLKWKQFEPSERVLWILPQLPSAHPFRPLYTEENFILGLSSFSTVWPLGELFFVGKV